MEDFYSEQEPSLTQLFDAIERKLDEMMGAFRYFPFVRFRLDYPLTMASQLFDRSSLRETGLNERPNPTDNFLTTLST